MGRKYTFLVTIVVMGLSTVLVLLGLSASAAGRALDAHRAWLLRAGGVLVILAGLRLLGVLRLPWLERERRPLLARLRGPRGLVGAYLFGAAFALGSLPGRHEDRRTASSAPPGD